MVNNTVDTLAELNRLYRHIHRFLDFRISPFEVSVYWNHSPSMAEWHHFDAQAVPLNSAMESAISFIISNAKFVS